VEDAPESSDTAHQVNKIKADIFEINTKPVLHKDAAKSLHGISTSITA